MRVGLVVALCGLLGLAGCAGGAIRGLSGASGSQQRAGSGGGEADGLGAWWAEPDFGGACLFVCGGFGGVGGAGRRRMAGVGLRRRQQCVGVAADERDRDRTASGDYYVTTGSDGSFSISGDYTCTAGQQVYLYAVGGDPGLGTGGIRRRG